MIARSPRPALLSPLARAVGQIGDPAFVGVLIRSVAWSAVCFVALHIGAIWAVHHLLEFHGWLAWGVDILGSLAASMLAFWLFLPVAAGIGMLSFDRIAVAVEQRFYPWLPPSRPAPMAQQVADAVVVGLRVLALNIAALGLAIILPGAGYTFGWMIAAYAIGRGLFVAVAMRRMPRDAAERVYRRNRGVVLVHGAILALACYIPVMNLFLPLVGTAAMIHILDAAMADARAGR